MTRTTLLLTAGLLVCTFALGCGRSERRAQRAAQAVSAKAPASEAATTAAKQSEKQDAKPKEEPKPAETDPQFVITGIDRDEGKAVQHAAEQAQNQIEAFLRTKKPPVLWRPTAEFIHKHLMTGTEHNPAREAEIRAKGLDYECWDVTFTITPAVYQQILREYRKDLLANQQKERDTRREERMAQEGKLLAIVLALLVGLVGYVRLDQCTNGKCSRVLRVALVGVLLASGAGMLWFF